MKITKLPLDVAELFLRLSIPEDEYQLLMQTREKERQNSSNNEPTRE